MRNAVARVIVPLFLFAYIGYETYLKLHHQSLCSAVGCKLAGELLRFPSIYLNYMGLMAVGAIALFGLLSLFNKAFEKIYFIALYTAIAFESIMIGYQIFANPEPCIFCLGVYGGLLLTALLSNPRWFGYSIPVIFAIFFALSDLAIPKNSSLIEKNGLYLIASDHCPHCKKVKKFFAQKHINYTKISVNNPSARYLAKFLGINEIPILIDKEGMNTNIIYGDEAIISKFMDKKDNTTNKKTENIPFKAEDNGGCSLSIESNGCTQDSGIPLR